MVKESIVFALFYLSTAFLLWAYSRRSENPIIRRKLRYPFGWLARLGLILGALHILFITLQINSISGFLFCWALVFVFYEFAVVSFYELVFWFPCRHNLIHTDIHNQDEKKDNFDLVEAVAVTDLKPTGRIAVKDQIVSARINHGSAVAGDSLLVVSSEGFEYLVSRKEESGYSSDTSIEKQNANHTVEATR